MAAAEQSLSLARRWVIYQSERFPVIKFAPLLGAFSFCGVCLSRLMRGEISWPSPASALVAFACVFLFFLQLRFLDEFKDYETDRRYRPERPVPRGLISLKQISQALALTVAAQVILTVWLQPALLWLLAGVWLYMGLMTVEFFVPAWIKPRLLTYMWTHMLIMPLIDFFATGCDWRPHQSWPPPGLALFLAVSFFNGLMVEMGRKTWAPEQERPGVDTYSSYCGLAEALKIFRGLMLISFAGIVGVGFQLRFALPSVLVMGLFLIFGLRLTARFQARPTPVDAGRLETFSGLWVMASYLMMGILPLGAAIWCH